MRIIFTGLLLGAVTACAPASPPPPDQAPLVLAFANNDTDELWTIQATTTDPLRLMLAEAELGARGQFESGDRYLGSRTRSSVGSSRYARAQAGSSTSAVNDRDCADFVSAASAQRFFLSAGGPTHDPHGLDRDGDGNACEWGVKISEVSRTRIRPVAVTAPAVRRPAYIPSRCYVGPRGGTYTITASGNKNYDGC